MYRCLCLTSGKFSVGNPYYERKNRHLIGSFADNIFGFFGSHPILKQCILNSMLWGGGVLHILCIPAITALFCLTMLEGFVIHHHSGHFSFKELVFNFHWNHRTFLSFVCLTCTPSISSTSSSSSY